MKKSILTIVLGAYLTLISAFNYIKSFESYDYGPDGKEFSVDENQIVIFITGLIVLFLGILMLNKFKTKDSDKTYLNFGLMLVGAVNFFAPLKPAFKIVYKVVDKKAGYELAQTLPYFFWAGFGVIVFLFGLFALMDSRKQK